MRKIIISTICLLTGFSPAYASGLTATQNVQKEVVIQNEDGSTEVKYVEANKIAPGEKVLYSLNIANDGTEPATDLVLVMPVPQEVKFIEGSANKLGSRVSFSVDDGETFYERDQLVLKTMDGSEKPANSDDITHVKWEIDSPVEAGTTDTLSFKGLLK